MILPFSPFTKPGSRLRDSLASSLASQTAPNPTRIAFSTDSDPPRETIRTQRVGAVWLARLSDFVRQYCYLAANFDLQLWSGPEDQKLTPPASIFNEVQASFRCLLKFLDGTFQWAGCQKGIVNGGVCQNRASQRGRSLFWTASILADNHNGPGSSQ